MAGSVVPLAMFFCICVCICNFISICKSICNSGWSSSGQQGGLDFLPPGAPPRPPACSAQTGHYNKITEKYKYNYRKIQIQIQSQNEIPKTRQRQAPHPCNQHAPPRLDGHNSERVTNVKAQICRIKNTGKITNTIAYKHLLESI